MGFDLLPLGHEGRVAAAPTKRHVAEPRCVLEERSRGHAYKLMGDFDVEREEHLNKMGVAQLFLGRAILS